MDCYYFIQLATAACFPCAVAGKCFTINLGRMARKPWFEWPHSLIKEMHETELDYLKWMIDSGVEIEIPAANYCGYSAGEIAISGESDRSNSAGGSIVAKGSVSELTTEQFRSGTSPGGHRSAESYLTRRYGRHKTEPLSIREIS
jgi:hypothetical protein